MGGDGGVGETLITNFGRAGGGGVGAGGLLAPAGCVDDGRVAVNFDASGAGSIFGVGSGFGIDLALGTDLRLCVGVGSSFGIDLALGPTWASAFEAPKF